MVSNCNVEKELCQATKAIWHMSKKKGAWYMQVI